MTDLTVTPTPIQDQRAKWDLLLLDLELRAEQVRQLKTYEGKRLFVQAAAAASGMLIAGAALGGLIVHLIGR